MVARRISLALQVELSFNVTFDIATLESCNWPWPLAWPADARNIAEAIDNICSLVALPL